MRQYIENSPGYSTAKYTNVGGRRQYTTQCWKPFLARRTETDRIGTVTGRIGTQTTVRLSRYTNHYQRLCNRRHTLSVLRFFLPKKPEPIHFLRAMRTHRFFIFSLSLARVAFSLVNLSNVFRLIASGVNTDASTWLLPSDLFCTYSQTEDRVANFLQGNRVFLCNHTCNFQESRHETSQAYFRLPQSHLQTSTKHLRAPH